ncbi:ABC transporter ATP-binding protein [Sphingobium sp. CR2-8]|uniref:ABC transporter ATP-binding protein n=1 Tax=Sphingobium sp. CR2-8 TaxID=1306534 RepID=UPI002DB6DF12|nr:ABC transporter ATP-binding protein [Sphingobium sp. CR2-8]MEC3909810.1 ABC transporter ATP-binding protein [Sphingobium sp. CR2-8]
MVTIAVHDLSVDLGRRPVLRHVSADFQPATLTGIIGPNGAGKSTLIKAMLGLLPAREGTVMIDGQDRASLGVRDLARRIAYLPQGQTLHWPLSVERVVALGRLPHLAPLSRITDLDRAAIVQAMARADVAHLAQRDATQLSGGERARVMLARALAVGTPALVVDEPLASLDPGHQIDVMDLLAREARNGATVVTVLHDLTMAARYCDRLILIDGGAVVARGTPADVLTAETLRQVYGISARIELAATCPMIVPIARTTGD